MKKTWTQCLMILFLAFSLIQCADDGQALPAADEPTIPGDEIPADVDPSEDQPADGELVEGTVYFEDADGDGFGNPDASVSADTLPVGHVEDNTDCNDADASIYPTAAETDGDSIDQDCDGSDNLFNEKRRTRKELKDRIKSLKEKFTKFYLDRDGDGFGNKEKSLKANKQPRGYVENHRDCNDHNALINPKGLDLPDNRKDEDCKDGDLHIIKSVRTPYDITTGTKILHTIEDKMEMTHDPRANVKNYTFYYAPAGSSTWERILCLEESYNKFGDTTDKLFKFCSTNEIMEEYHYEIAYHADHKSDMLSNATTYILDSDMDGVLDETREFLTTYELEYDNDKLKKSTETKLRTNGDVSEINYFTYDDNGNVIKESTDRDGDGTIEIKRHLNYDKKGRLQVITSKDGTDLDGNAVIRITSKAEFEYDEMGGVITETKTHSDADGNVVKIELFESVNEYK